jgi:hypothetical protein
MSVRYILLIVLGLAAPCVYLLTGGPFGTHRYLVTKPSYTLFISPLPLVFDTEDFFKVGRIVREDDRGKIVVTDVDRDFFKGKLVSPHVRLHFNRFLGFGRYLVSDELVKELFCEEGTKRVKLEVRLVKEKTFTTERDVLCP